MTKRSPLADPEISVYIGLGSNLGDRQANLDEAVRRIGNLGLNVTNTSSIYETEPEGFADQPWFLNQVIEAKMEAGLGSAGGLNIADAETTTAIQARKILSELLEIEHAMGRQRTRVNGPRVIDLDLLLLGNKVVGHSNSGGGALGTDDIFVPHPRMHLRRFVLEPLCEIAPDLMHPILKARVRELLANLADNPQVRPHTR